MFLGKAHRAALLAIGRRPSLSIHLGSSPSQERAYIVIKDSDSVGSGETDKSIAQITFRKGINGKTQDIKVVQANAIRQHSSNIQIGRASCRERV